MHLLTLLTCILILSACSATPLRFNGKPEVEVGQAGDWAVKVRAHGVAMKREF